MFKRLLAPGKLLPLLISLVALFVLYPIMVELERVRFFRFGMVMVLILAVYSIGGSRWHLWAAALLGAPAGVAQIAAFAEPQGSAPLVATMLGLAFLIFTTVVVFTSVLRSGPVTGDKIAGAIAVYLLLGLIWALLYGLVAIIDPASFRLPADLVFDTGIPGSEYAFIYYSFVTLTTLGYGEISPANHWSQTFAWMEAVTGQLFLAILIARMVGLHIAHPGVLKETRRTVRRLAE
ncbi:MAG: two pore domain potassium channel family protein [bacterium]|nr:two pore domain potassium channel family protein [bacterium]